MESRAGLDLSQYLEYLNKLKANHFSDIIQEIDGADTANGRLFSNMHFSSDDSKPDMMAHDTVAKFNSNEAAIVQRAIGIYIDLISSEVKENKDNYEKTYLDMKKTEPALVSPINRVDKAVLNNLVDNLRLEINAELNDLWDTFLVNNKEALSDVSDDDKIKLRDFIFNDIVYHMSGVVKNVADLANNVDHYPALQDFSKMMRRHHELTFPNLNAMKEGPAKVNRRASLRDFGKRITSANLGYGNTPEKKQNEEKEVKVDANENKKTENENLQDKKRSRFAAARSLTQKNVRYKEDKEDKEVKQVKEDKNADKKEHKNKGSMFSSLSIFKPYPDDSKDKGKGKAKEKAEDNSNEKKHKM